MRRRGGERSGWASAEAAATHIKKKWTNESAFQMATVLLFLGGFLTLVFADGVHPLLAAAVIPAILMSARIRPIALKPLTQMAIFALISLIAVIDFLTLSSFIDSTVHLMLLAGLSKLYSRRYDKDYLLLALISFSFLLVASSYTISAVFLASLATFIFLSILTLVLFESRKAYSNRGTAEFSLKSYLHLSLGVTALIALIAAPIFVLIPRTTLGFFRTDQAMNLRLSGFSDQVKLGEMGRIISNSSPVMRIRVDRPLAELPPDLKWRGIALDFYDGQSWRVGRPEDWALEWDRTYEAYLMPVQWKSGQANKLWQRVSLEVESPVIFGADDILLIQDPSVFRPLERDINLNISRPFPSISGYTVYSDVSTRMDRIDAAQSGDQVEELDMTSYLQLPSDLNPRIRDLAAEVTNLGLDPLGKALRLERYLRRSFGYSLENRAAKGKDPLSSFLFDVREGHCEYFATAQAVMMRTMGIPARVVNGFRRGDYSSLTTTFTVRQSHAHSWAEGYFPGGGWIGFDPTPAAPSDFSAGLSHFFSDLAEALDIIWNEVITFDQMKQAGLARTFSYGLRAMISDLSELPGLAIDYLGLRDIEWREAWRWPGIYWILGALAIALAAQRWRRPLRLFVLQRILKRKDAEIAPQYYLQMLDILGRRGLSRSKSETPAEFARRAGSHLRSELPGRITDIYYRNRFGGRPLRESELDEVYSGLKRLRSSKV